MSRPVSAVDLCKGKLLAAATVSIKDGSHCSSGPHVPSGKEIVACKVGGSWSEGLLVVRPFLALTVAISAAVASTCAKGFLICDDGR